MVARTLERAALGALFASTISTILLVVRNGLAPAPGRGSFGLAFWTMLLAAYAAAALLATVFAGAMVAMLRQPLLQRWLVVIPAGVFPALALALNPRASAAVFSLPGSDPFRWLCLMALVVSVAGLVLVAALPLTRRATLRLLAAAVALATWFALSPPPSAEVVAAARPGGVAAHVQRFVLIGVDGADWQYLEPLLARGELPHLAGLRARGAWGPLATLQPTLSPAIWTTMATGAKPRRHGVRGFETVRLRGIEETLPDLHPLRGLGVRQVLHYLRSTGRIHVASVSSATRRVPAFWNIATAFGSPVSVVNWWATAPADRVMGHVISERLYYEELGARGRRRLPPRLTHPEELADAAARLVVLPDQILLEDTRPFVDVSAEEFKAMQVTHPSPLTGISNELTYFISTFETTRRLALHVLKEGRRAFGVPGDLLVLFRIVDKTCHTALQFSDLVQEHGGATADELKTFGRVVTGAYKVVDSAVGDIQRAFPEANVLIVSDHGFELEADRGAYNHTRAPRGVLIAAGPAFRSARLEGLSVYDIMPLLLYLKGLPQADDMPGSLPEAALDPAMLLRQPVRRVQTYGDRYSPRAAGGTPEADAEMRERLRALGYLQ